MLQAVKIGEKNMANKKLKTHKGAAKRFKMKANGQAKHKPSHMRHILTKKSAKRKRHLRGLKQVHSSDVMEVKKLLNKA